MEFLNQEATEILAKLLRLLKGDSIEIKNEPFCPLYIEKSLSGIETECGKAELYDICVHYFIGDVMRVPEMGFAVLGKGGRNWKDFHKLKIAPYYLQHDDLRQYETSMKLEGDRLVVCDADLQKSHTHYANLWLADLNDLGYLK